MFTANELLEVAEVVAILTARYREQADRYEKQQAEHRAAFGARTEADRKIIAGLREESAKCQAELDDLYQREGIEKKRRMDVEDERDGLLTQVQDMREEIIRVNDAHGQTLVECDALRAKVDLLTTLRPKYKVGDKLESYSSAVTIVGVRTVYDCQADGAEYPVGHSEDELTERYEQTPPEATHAEPDLTQLHAKGKEAWSDVPNATQWVEEMRGNSEATHDTEAGKAAAEAVIRDSQSRDINYGDLVEVVSNTGRNTWLADVGSVGTVTSIETINDSISVCLDDVPGKKNALAGYVSLCDVRKVTT